MYNLIDVRNALGVGARSNKFRVNIPIPKKVQQKTGITKDLELLAKSVEIPEISNEPIKIPWQGRELKLPSDTKYGETTTIGFYEPANMLISRTFNAWQIALDNFQTNMRSDTPFELLSDIEVSILDGEQQKTCIFKLQGAWPSQIKPGEFNSEEGNVVISNITFAFTSICIGDGFLPNPDPNAPMLPKS